MFFMIFMFFVVSMIFMICLFILKLSNKKEEKTRNEIINELIKEEEEIKPTKKQKKLSKPIDFINETPTKPNEIKEKVTKNNSNDENDDLLLLNSLSNKTRNLNKKISKVVVVKKIVEKDLKKLPENIKTPALNKPITIKPSLLPIFIKETSDFEHLKQSPEFTVVGNKKDQNNSTKTIKIKETKPIENIEIINSIKIETSKEVDQKYVKVDDSNDKLTQENYRLKSEIVVLKDTSIHIFNI